MCRKLVLITFSAGKPFPEQAARRLQPEAWVLRAKGEGQAFRKQGWKVELLLQNWYQDSSSQRFFTIKILV